MFVSVVLSVMTYLFLLLVFVEGHGSVPCGMDFLKKQHDHTHPELRRKLGNVHSDFSTLERSSSSFSTPTCLSSWGTTTECFNGDIAESYVEALPRLPPVTLKIEHCVLEHSMYGRTVSQSNIDLQVNVARTLYAKANITLDVTTNVVQNDVLYARTMHAWPNGMTLFNWRDRCESTDLSCANSCGSGSWDADNLCELIDGYFPSMTNKDSCLNTCSDDTLYCLEAVVAAQGCPGRQKDDCGFPCETYEMYASACNLLTTDNIVSIWSSQGSYYCGLAMNRDFISSNAFPVFNSSMPASIFQDTSVLGSTSACGGYTGNTFAHELGHALSLYHTFSDTDLASLSADRTTCEAPACASRNDDWNTGDFIKTTRVWPARSGQSVKTRTMDVDDLRTCIYDTSGGSGCGLGFNTTKCGGSAPCYDELIGSGPHEEQENVMSYNFVPKAQCPLEHVVDDQLGRVRCWIDRQEIRSLSSSTQRATPSLVSFVSLSSSSNTVTVSWVPPLSTLAAEWSAGTVSYRVTRTPVFGSGAYRAVTDGTRSLIDRNVTDGETYSYTITPYVGSNFGPESNAYSIEATADSGSSSSDDDDDDKLIYAAIGGGGLVLVLIIACVVFFVCRRKN